MRARQMRSAAIIAAIAMILAIAMMLLLVTGCKEKQKAGAEASIIEGKPSVRPDYLPDVMFKNLPEMPADFYQMRDSMRSGKIRDLGKIGLEYYMQPEWFPNFEEAGLPLLQNPPEGRWGAFGFGSYPSDTVSTLVAGDTLKLHFYMRSSYLVETYQGISLTASFPESEAMVEGYTLPDGSAGVTQDPAVKNYFDVEVSPKIFVLEPNFPIYSKNGTILVELSVTAKENAEPGNYVVAVDAGDAPDELHEQLAEMYGNRYAGSSFTKINRPYYRAFIVVAKQNQTEDNVQTGGTGE
jgi:hypothetical protein